MISLVLVAVNLGLAVTLAYMVYSMRLTGQPLAPVRPQFVTNTVTQISVRKINATNAFLAALANRPLSWQALEATNYTAFIENLRTFGCPEETVRDIIITDVARLYGKRRAAIRAQARGTRYWLPDDGAETPAIRAQLRALEREEQQLIKALLGVDLRRELARYAGEEAVLDANLSFLPQDKQEQMAALQEKYADLEEEIYRRARGVFLDEDQEQLRQLHRAREAELAQLLTPQELEDYQVRNSETANSLRAALNGFQPTEDEFRRIFRLQKTYDDEFGHAFDTTDEAALAVRAKAQQDAQEALDAEVAKVLGPERFAEYQRSQDEDYRSLVQLGERFDLSRDVANAVYEMKQTAERQKVQVELNADLTEEQRTQMLAAIANETERSVASAMGLNVYKAYARTAGGWISELSTPQIALSDLKPPQPPPPPIPPLPPELKNFLINPPVLGNPPPVQVNPAPIGKQ